MVTPRVLGPFVVLVLRVFVEDEEGIKDNMLLDLLRSSSFVPSWHRAMQLT
jgi:hypothetical protein